jgi:hypothetical protein
MRAKVLIFASLLGLAAGDAWAARIYVTTEDPGIGTGACSLQEAIYSSVLHDTMDGTHGIAIDATDQGNPPDHFITTGCVIGDGDDTIVLPTAGTLKMVTFLDGDAYNPYGPTATPLIFSTITIEGNGARLEWDPAASGNVRLFAIGAASIKTPNGTASGTGSLTLRNAYVGGFHVKGGDGRDGGGGGLGAGGAIYLQNGSLVIESSTFESNWAIGGNGSQTSGSGGGGGGGLSGNGGHEAGAGGGGGGARGDGGNGFGTGGGGGGGTVFSGGTADVGGPGGYLNGGNGGGPSNDGAAAKGPGGGGGGGGFCTNCGPGTLFTQNGSGGDGGYGGGGGGGGDGGGRGGFGGGGGSGGLASGGDGGFGGGGGNGGAAGSFGGNGDDNGAGGGGAALGGAIFSDGGIVTIHNSTFTNNEVRRSSAPAGSGAQGGQDTGGAVFSHNADLTIVNSTFSGNRSEGFGGGGGVVIYMDPSDSGIGGPDIFIKLTIDNSIFANNGVYECFFTGNVHTQGVGNLIMRNAPGSQPYGACPGVVTADDPQLGGLQDNGGFTRTMAIPFGSVAMSAADPSTSLSTDQRGQVRPQAGGFDIGAYEICRRQLAGGLIEPMFCSETTFAGFPTTTLTIQSSTPSGGTVTPAPGTYTAPQDTVEVVSAAPASGYYLKNWTGNVAQPNSLTTTIVIGNQPQTVTANFQLHDFTLSADPTSFMLPLGGATATSYATATALGDFADPIELTATGHPAGVAASLSANVLTPVVGSPATSTLTIAVGPSVTPLSFVETIAGNSSGLAGALTHSAQVNVTFVITPEGLVKIIDQDLTLGCIVNPGLAQSLTAKVNAYQTLASAGHVQSATNILAAFQYEVQAQIGHLIVTSCKDPVGGNSFSPGQALLADAQALQATLGTAVKAAPIVGTVASTSDAGVAGRTVNLLSGKTVIATASTDAVGFYYLDTGTLRQGSQYAVTVTIPKGYKSSSPQSQTFTWMGNALRLVDFVLN